MPKSRIFGRPSAVNDDVRRLEVAVDDAAGMGMGERVGNLRRRGAATVGSGRPSGAIRRSSGSPVDQLHDDERTWPRSR